LIDDLSDVVTLPRQSKQGSFVAQKVTDLVASASESITRAP